MGDCITYFAYGSNMSLPRLRARVPQAEVIGPGCLPGHYLAFHKRGRDGSAKCDACATDSDSDRLFGALFHIPVEGKQALDRFEGLGAGYDEKVVRVMGPAGQWLAALTYVATDINDNLLPYWWYRHHVLTGARAFALPPAHIDQILAVDTMADPDPVRRHREMSTYLRPAI